MSFLRDIAIGIGLMVFGVLEYGYSWLKEIIAPFSDLSAVLISPIIIMAGVFMVVWACRFLIAAKAYKRKLAKLVKQRAG